MRAAVIREFGAPERLRSEDVAMPTPAPDQMLVRVEACGVCGHDLLNRAGHFPHTKLPCVMGHEIAGTVVECGPLVKRFQPGDRIAVIQRIACGLCHPCRTGRENICVSGPGFYGEGLSGGYGDYVVAAERNAVAVPATMPAEVAAVLSCAIGTGFHALRRAGLGLGDTVLVTGASGGVGLHTIKLARLMGLRAIAVSSTEDKRRRLIDAGASEVIVAPDYRFHEAVKSLTRGEGVDAVIEITGTRTFGSSMRAVRSGGRVVIVGNVEPGNVPLNPAMSILREVDLIGSAHATLTDLRRVVELVAAGAIEPELAACLPRDEAAQAHRLMEQRTTAGRVVLMHPKQ